MTFLYHLPSLFESIHDKGLSLPNLWSIIASSAIGAGLYWLLTPPKVSPDLDAIPTISAFTFIWAVINLPQDKQYKLIWQKKFEKNGMAKMSIFGRTVVFVASPEIIKYQNAHNDVIRKQERLNMYPNSYFSRLFGRNIVNTNGDVWKHQRKVANPAFREIDIQVFIESSKELAQYITDKSSKGPFNILTLMQSSALDILGKAVFSFNFNALQDPNGHLVKVYREIMAELPNPLAVAFPSMDHLFRSQKAWDKLAVYEKLIYGFIEQKRRDGLKESDKDLLSRMMLANENPENRTLTDFELRSNMIVFMLAGHDTTAVSLTYMVYFMAMNKDVQSRARKEVLDVFGPELDINITSQRNLDYLNACIKETLRLCPPAFQAFPRQTSEDFQMNNGITIPNGTTIIHHIYAMQHDPQYWSDPEVFKPERFLDPLAPPSTAWGPFSSGPRSCPGTNFSMLEQRVIMSHLLRSFEWDLMPGSIHEDGIKFTNRTFGVLSPKEMLINFRPISV